jgi:hypothetical protein
MLARTSLLAVCLALVCGCARPLTVEEKLEQDIANPVKGFVEPKDLKNATFSMTTVEYFGGFTTRTEFQGGKATVTKSSMMEGMPKQAPRVYTLTPADQEAWADVVNVIVREELWTQGDVKTSGVADGGEVIYEFKVGEHEGKFKLINSSPEHLHVFSIKAANLVNLVHARLDGTVPKK